MVTQTLCLLKKENQILLAMKKRGFGAGNWNGVGGKLQEGETIESAAVREAKEEIGVAIAPEDLNKIGDMKFYFKDGKSFRVHTFFVSKWEGEPAESEEMTPKWFNVNELPFDHMWPDDKHWLPVALAGKKFNADFYFNESGKDFDKFEIREI